MYRFGRGTLKLKNEFSLGRPQGEVTLMPVVRDGMLASHMLGIRGFTASQILGMDYGSTASLRLRMAMTPRLPQGRVSADAIGWDRGGCDPLRMYFWAGLLQGLLYVFLGGPLPKKRVALRASPGIYARRLAAMLVCWCVI